MGKEKTIETKLGGYISSLLRDYFGKGPTSAYVTIQRPFITVQVQGFLAPTEKVLIVQNETRRILETRDLLMDELRPEIKLEFWKLANFDIKEIYADWNLDNKTGLFMMIMNEETDNCISAWPEKIDEEAVYKVIIEASIKGQRKPDYTKIHWLSNRVIMIERSGIFVEIEKELIKSGFWEELKLAKRPLEYRLLPQSELNVILNRSISDVYLDWDFKGDKGYMVLVLEPSKNKSY